VATVLFVLDDTLADSDESSQRATIEAAKLALHVRANRGVEGEIVTHPPDAMERTRQIRRMSWWRICSFPITMGLTWRGR
jgi:phosphoglycolate phosphatase-like HAD superfamily hydrolase